MQGPAKTLYPGLPPGSRLPPRLQALAFAIAPGRWIEANRRRHGNLFTAEVVPGHRSVFVTHPDLVRQVFRSPSEVLGAGAQKRALMPIIGETSVLLVDGEEHMRYRKLLLPCFHGERVRTYEDMVVGATDRAIDGWPVGEAFALLPWMYAVVLDALAYAVFGMREGPRREELKRKLRSLMAPVSHRRDVVLHTLSRGRLGNPPGEDLFGRRKGVFDFVLEEVARRRAEPDLAEREDVLSTLLLARDEDGRPLSDDEVRDQLMTLLVAGQETTAASLAFTFDLLLHNPPVLARVRENLGDHELLDAVLKESLRMRPVITGVSRIVSRGPFELGGYAIPRGSQISCSTREIHRRADLFPAPDEFRPERFLGDGAPDGATWIAFGGGTRRCLGAGFATMEMRAVLRRVLERTRLEPVGRRPDRGVGRAQALLPRRGVRVIQATPPPVRPPA